MKLLCTALVGVLVTTTWALAPSNTMDRRSLFSVVSSSAAAALALPDAAKAGLLDDYGADPDKIIQKESNTPKFVAKGENAIDPTLRASYYYPTAKKRYLPRIQKVSNSISSMPPMIDVGNWEAVSEFYKTADNAILPMKLYVSSLDGQGLGMTNAYAKSMMADCALYETQCGVFRDAISNQDKDRAISAISEMGVAVTEYRQTGRLTDDDGNIPSVDDLRRLAMRRPTGKY